MTILVTGGAGFIGSNFILTCLAQSDEMIVNLDKLTYAGNLANLVNVEKHPAYVFIQGDIADRSLVDHLLRQYRPRAIVHFAAESHVDRSIYGPDGFIQTNIVGTFQLLESARAYWQDSPEKEQQAFRFLHVSTDEVYGSLASAAAPFSETHVYQPNSPYSASKAASDHLVRAWFHTYGLPVLTTNCSNNYGPYQFPEKLIPLMITRALEGQPLPIYGDGKQIRDWLYVEDHCEAILKVLARGRLGETYNIGGWNEKTNLDIVKLICQALDVVQPRVDGQSYITQIAHVADRPGHDRRYAIDASKIKAELGWQPKETFETGLRKTIEWYLANPNWIAAVQSGEYQQWLSIQYSEPSSTDMN